MINITRKYEAGLRLLKYTAAPAVLMMVPNAAEAAFIGAFDPLNWTTTTAPGDGSVDTSGAPASITVIGADNGVGQNIDVFYNTDYTITLGAPISWTFDWSYTSNDAGGYDFAGYLLNGAYTELANANGASGSVGPIAALAGDTIGFRVGCTDCVFGRGALTITSFNESAGGVPEPSSLALMTLGLAGLAAARRRRNAN